MAFTQRLIGFKIFPGHCVKKIFLKKDKKQSKLTHEGGCKKETYKKKDDRGKKKKRNRPRQGSNLESSGCYHLTAERVNLFKLVYDYDKIERVGNHIPIAPRRLVL